MIRMANCFLVTIFLFTSLASAAGPEGWYLAGSNPADYESKLDEQTFYRGNSSALLRSKTDEAEGFGTLMQMISPKDYKGERVRLSGYVKSDEVESWAGLWMRIDGVDPNKPLAFDNMSSRPIRGTTEWTRYEIVLDVPETSRAIAFGFLLHGSGNLWADGLELEKVGDDVPTTDLVKEGTTWPKSPINLDFEGS